MHTVLNDVFPVASLKCCRFHLGQAWYRKMQNLGLSQDYKDSDSEIGKWLKQSFGLHFLDPTEVEDCFVEDYKASAAQDERCIKYADYLVENYVTIDSGTHQRFSQRSLQTTNVQTMLLSHFIRISMHNFI